MRAALICTAVSLLVAPGAGIAQGERYPSKPIRFVLPFPAGGATDLVGRTVAEKLQEGLRHPVVLDFRPGAGGNLGTSIVAKSAPDGYTLLLCSPTLAISPSIYKNPGYDPLRDLAPISLAATIPTLVVVHPSVPVRTVRDLIQLARKSPGKLNFGSGGVGSSNHLAGELFKSL
ncbi:MAG: tripartite tricarboxylate transporter substrate binding protein, partial [Betaproteobacteria bacterium]|nr:tripartite tricarboxylate transporter substrate binding protein [Betaproteobacteria bacterium]